MCVGSQEGHQGGGVASGQERRDRVVEVGSRETDERDLEGGAPKTAFSYQ